MILRSTLEHVSRDVRQRMWVQHDGASALFSYYACEYLNQTFPEMWIGRGGPDSWLARTPDLPHLFILVESLVYETPVENEVDVLVRILAACDIARMIPGILERMRQNLLLRCHGVRQFEQVF